MRISAKFIDRLTVQRRMRDYPIYTPPFARSEPLLSRREMAANYHHFLEHKAARLNYLAGYLGAFSVQLRLEPEALLTVERWLYRYGGHLLPARTMQTTPGAHPRNVSALFNYEPAWVSRYHGLNIINDLAIFAGEYIISRNHDARWGMWYGDGEKWVRQTGVSGHPCILGLHHFHPEHHYSVLTEIVECCHSAQRWNSGWVLAWERQSQRNLARRLSYLAAPSPEFSASVSLGRGRQRPGPLLQRKGVRIYEVFKGERPSNWCYALVPNCQAKGSDEVFDIRRLPMTYRSDLVIEDSGTYDTTLGRSEQQRFFAALDAQRRAHMIAIKRAIDDGYDLNAAARGNYGQFARRLVRSMWSSRVRDRREPRGASVRPG